MATWPAADSVSLFCCGNFAVIRKKFPVLLRREVYGIPSKSAVIGFHRPPAGPKVTKFPVNSLFIRELPSETGSLQTARTAIHFQRLTRSLGEHRRNVFQNSSASFPKSSAFRSSLSSCNSTILRIRAPGRLTAGCNTSRRSERCFSWTQPKPKARRAALRDCEPVPARF